jgi:hypothetical protein
LLEDFGLTFEDLALSLTVISRKMEKTNRDGELEEEEQRGEDKTRRGEGIEEAGLLEMLKERGSKERGEGEEVSRGGRRVDALWGGVRTLSLCSVGEYFKGFDFRKKPDEQFFSQGSDGHTEHSTQQTSLTMRIILKETAAAQRELFE